MPKVFLMSSAILGFLAVALGAFASHALKDRLDAYHLGVFRTGVEYQFFHVFALAMVAWLSTRSTQLSLVVSGFAFLVGIVLFSGSLYALALSGVRILGIITPFGGVSFLVGWALLLYTISRTNFPT
jgi:uncharacterized membrane protein YgdD (TMEM256/DUF423 family)